MVTTPSCSFRPKRKRRTTSTASTTSCSPAPKTSLNGDAGKGTDYNRNAWLVYAANELTAKEDLQAVIAESLGANFNVDEFSEKFPRGNNIGEYNQAKYDAFMALYNKSQEILNGGATATDDEIDQLRGRSAQGLHDLHHLG